VTLLSRRSVIIAAAAATAALLGAKAVLIDSFPSSQGTSRPLAIERWRALIEGDAPARLPVSVGYISMAEANVPKSLAVAGAGLRKIRMGVVAFQISYREGSLMVDSGYDRDSHVKLSNGPVFSDEKHSRLQALLREAGSIVLTHEHPDHVMGVFTSANSEALKRKLIVTREQVGGLAHNRIALSPDQLAGLAGRAHPEMFRVAPGVVLIKTPGHTPGSQSVFVRLRDGREYLMIGDIAWNVESLANKRGRALLIGKFMLGEDRGEVARQLSTLHELARSEPKLLILPSHDVAYLEGLASRGDLKVLH